MSHPPLTTTERVKIETYLELRMSIRSIARRLGRHPSTVAREVKQNPSYESGRPAVLREEEGKLRRQDEDRRGDSPDDHRETVGDLVPGTDRRSSLRRGNRLLDHPSLDLLGTD